MKPREEEWTLYQSGKSNHGIYGKDPRRVVATRIATYDEAMLISAAPDMARELRHLPQLLEPLEQSGALDVPGLATLNGARAALRKAGVLDE